MLTPAPWVVVKSRDVQSAVISPGVASVCHDFESDDDAELVARARNAHDVMMRRGWSPVKAVGIRWILVENELNEHVDSGKLVTANDCPFACLVEADKWYKENVENQS